MADNSLSTLIEEIFSVGIQEVLKKTLVAEKICGKRAHAALQKGGDTFNYPYVSRGVLQTYTAGTGVTKQLFSGTNESMGTPVTKVFNFILDDTEMRKQMRRAQILAQKQEEAMEEISSELDGAVMYRYQDAQYKYGSGGLTTSLTTAGLTLSPSNIGTSFGKVFAHLSNRIGKLKSKFCVIDDFIMDQIAEAAIGNTYNISDATWKNGYSGIYKGFKLYSSNNLSTEIVLTVGTGTIAEDDYITIKGTTLTFMDALASNGDLHVCDSVANNCTNIAAALNAPGTDITEAAGTGYQAYDATDADDELFNLNRLVATATATTVTIKSQRGRMQIDSSFADSTISFGTEVVHCIAGEEGAIELAYQEKGKAYINMNPTDASGNTLLAKEYNYLTMYYVKTFREGERKIVDIQINA